MNMKWLLCNFFIPQKVPMRTSIIIRFTSKFFSASCALLMAGFTSKKVNYILRDTIQILRSNGRYALRRWWFKLCVLVICLQILHLGLLQGPQKSFSVVGGGTLVLIRMFFKLFPFLKPIIGTSQKLFCVPYPVLEEDEF